jgi:GH35 family endo-1,4-beta-xylanase
MDGETSQNWDCQLWWPLAENLQAGVTYYYGVWVKSPDNINVQFIGQNASYSGLYKGTVTATNEWTLLEGEFTYDGNPADVVRIGLQFGGTPNSVVFVDDFQFGKKVEDPMDNVITNSNFDDGTADGWTGWSHYTRTVEEGGHSGKYALKCTMDGETSQNWDCQLWWPLAENLQAGTIYSYSFYIKSPDAVVAQFIGQNESYSGLYKLSFTAPEEWLKCEGEFTYDGNPADVVRIGLQFGGKPNSVLWVDDFKFGKKKDQTPAAGSRRAGGITFEAKTAEEKNQLLTEVMENWVKGVAEHLAAKEIVPVAYDVINEAIADGSNGVRGLNGVFGGSITDDDGNVTYDSAPVETEEDGLTLNWGSGHWYWGYYVPDYAVKAFQFARKYLPASTKLFYNDYNLESSDSKRAAAIQFVKDIDAANGSAIVDGIGTQMHVSFSPTDDADENAEKLAELKARVDKQFQELAATGKLVRVTELDISVNTGSPSAAQYKAQADAYQLIFESYFENVPEAQQSGITIWSLTDAEDEHEYWLKGQVPNLWDASFKRKWAYKGVCDALAGEDVGLTFGSETYKAYYEKNNVSDTVK